MQTNIQNIIPRQAVSCIETRMFAYSQMASNTFSSMSCVWRYITQPNINSSREAMIWVASYYYYYTYVYVCEREYELMECLLCLQRWIKLYFLLYRYDFQIMSVLLRTKRTQVALKKSLKRGKIKIKLKHHHTTTTVNKTVFVLFYFCLAWI